MKHNPNRDYDQLRAYLAALAELEHQIDEINEVKGRLFREARACGFERPIVRDLLRMRQAGKLPDTDVPSAYEGILDARYMADRA
ncbi:hypothetical protein [Roseobacter phage RDJL6]|nr:hypothetical protein [Roseobacter phage RDJL6]